jgi:hypothetical protein
MKSGVDLNGRNQFEQSLELFGACRECREASVIHPDGRLDQHGGLKYKTAALPAKRGRQKSNSIMSFVDW